jgi:hypothetical protein
MDHCHHRRSKSPFVDTYGTTDVSRSDSGIDAVGPTTNIVTPEIPEEHHLGWDGWVRERRISTAYASYFMQGSILTLCLTIIIIIIIIHPCIPIAADNNGLSTGGSLAQPPRQ